jgi:hypothetical protein
MSKHVTFCAWGPHTPHLNEAAQATLLKAMPPHQRDARAKGIPRLGAGAIYPILESDIAVTDFPIPDFWPRAFGMDVGWKWTAGTWEARNPDTGVTYIYRVYKKGYAEPSTHAAAFRGTNDRDAWIPGDIDPAANGRSQEDGTKLIDDYRSLGLNIEPAPHAVESGIYDTFNALSTGMLKVFKTCVPWFEEYRIYRRDEKGRVVKENDHLMDCTRYRRLAGIGRMKAVPPPEKQHMGDDGIIVEAGSALGWMGT